MKRRAFIQSMLISSGSLILGAQIATGQHQDENRIKIRMIYNNVGKGEMLSDWGLSVFIERNDEHVLFDTGGKPEILIENMRIAGIEPSQISRIVISHNHWDHVNGLDAFLDEAELEPKVYVPEYSFEDIQYNFTKAQIIGVSQSVQINQFAWSTGQLEGQNSNGQLFEQSLIVKQDASIYLFTGCSHPGIVNIVEKARRIFPEDDIKLVAGGFHLIDHTEKQIYDISYKLKNLNVEKIAPSHCTGDVAVRIFQDEWENDFVNFDLSLNEISI